MEIINQDFENILHTEKEEKKKKLIPKKMMLLGGLVLIFLLILILLEMSSVLKQNRVVPRLLPTPTPSPIPTLVEKITNQSFYATDSAVLKIENELKKIEEKLDNTDLKESSLNPPLLDWKVEF